MKNRYLTALALAAAINPTIHANTTPDVSPTNSCFLTGKAFTSYNVPDRMDTLEAGHFTEKDHSGFWQLDQGIGTVSFRENEGKLTTSLTFRATRLDEYSRTRSGYQPSTPGRNDYSYFVVSTNGSAPITGELNKSNEQAIFSGKEVFCNETSFSMVISDQQLFTPSNKTPTPFIQGSGGLLLRGTLNPESFSGEIFLRITSLRDILSSRESEGLNEVSTISVTVNRNFQQEEANPASVTTHDEAYYISHRSTALYNAMPSVSGMAKTAYKTSSKASSSAIGTVNSAYQAASGAIAQVTSAYEAAPSPSEVVTSVYEATPGVADAAVYAYRATQGVIETAISVDEAVTNAAGVYGGELIRQVDQNSRALANAVSDRVAAGLYNGIPKAFEMAATVYEATPGPVEATQAIAYAGSYLLKGYDTVRGTLASALEHAKPYGIQAMDIMSRSAIDLKSVP